MPNRPSFKHGESRAYYMPALDMVNMPAKELFKTDEQYYSVAFHEFAHSTGHASRLNRKEVTDGSKFGSHDYSIEELVAEMTAVFLCHETGIQAPFDNSIAYLKSWLKAFKNDTKMIMTASSRAQKATDYILNRTPDYLKKEEEKTS